MAGAPSGRAVRVQCTAGRGARHIAAARRAARLPAALAGVLLAACTDAGPAAQVPADYVGEWRAPGMHLIIGADGTVDYRRVRAATTTRLTAPIRSFDGDGFEVGVGPLATRFQVSVPPHLDGGEWKMTVDGVELTRAAKGTAI